MEGFQTIRSTVGYTKFLTFYLKVQFLIILKLRWRLKLFCFWLFFEALSTYFLKNIGLKLSKFLKNQPDLKNFKRLIFWLMNLIVFYLKLETQYFEPTYLLKCLFCFLNQNYDQKVQKLLNNCLNFLIGPQNHR